MQRNSNIAIILLLIGCILLVGLWQRSEVISDSQIEQLKDQNKLLKSQSDSLQIKIEDLLSIKDSILKSKEVEGNKRTVIRTKIKYISNEKKRVLSSDVSIDSNTRYLSDRFGEGVFIERSSR